MYYSISRARVSRHAGPLLETSWEKEQIACQLLTCFNMLRNIPAPGYFGPLECQSSEKSIFWISPHDEPDQHRQMSGPFKSEVELNTALVQKYLYNGGPARKAKFNSRLFPSTLRDHPAVSGTGTTEETIITNSDRSFVLVDLEAAG